MVEKNSPIDVILNEFVKYERDLIKHNGGSGKSAYQYRQVINAFGVDEAFVHATSAERNFLELLPKLLIIDDKEYIEKIVAGLEKNVLNIDNYKWPRGLKSYKTYLSSFLKFVSKIIEDSDIHSTIVDKFKMSNLNITINDLDRQMLYPKDDNKYYKYSTLVTTFKTRLNRQERTSGDKIWLPLTFINKICRKDYLNWLKELVNSIHIHYYDEKFNCVRDVTMGDGGINIKLEKSSDSNMYYVKLILEKEGEIETYQVLTPTGRGNKKEPLSVKKSETLGEIEIDHVKPIDKTLRDHSDKLKQLQEITAKYKELKDRGLEKSVTALNEAAKEISFKLNGLKGELDLIRKDSPLRLMAKKYNSQKSNGTTFKEIWKIEENKEEYWGILEENGIFYDGQELFLYQELKDDFPQETEFKVAKKSQKPNNISRVEDDQLDKIINKI